MPPNNTDLSEILDSESYLTSLCENLRQKNSALLPSNYLKHTSNHQKYSLSISENFEQEFFGGSGRLKKAQKSKVSNGEQIFKRIVRALTKTEHIKLFPYQLQLCEMCTVPALPGIYREEYSKNKKKILSNHGITLENMFTEVFFLSSRRMGKSLTMAFNANAYAMSIPYDGTRPMVIAVFSVTRAAAEQFVKECQNALRCMPLVDEFIIEVKAQEIVFRNKADPNDVRIIKSFCSRGDVSSNTHTRMQTHKQCELTMSTSSPHTHTCSQTHNLLLRMMFRCNKEKKVVNKRGFAVTR